MSLPARWWSVTTDDDGRETALCDLCPHQCRIHTGNTGYCGARTYDGQELRSPYLGLFSSIAVDPIEKKPLYHWRGGSQILSLGSLGCTMRCPFCQNHTIAHLRTSGTEKGGYAAPPRLTEVSAQALAAKTRELGLDSVAYTYNEPALQAEYILAAAPVLRESGIATVLVSNGMYSERLLADLAPVVDAANIDLKCFNARTYARLGGDLDAAKRAIRSFLAAGVHVEVTTLVAPGVSDSAEEFAAEVDWLAAVSPKIPLHISRYRPAHKFTAPPTDIVLLQRFFAIASAKLAHVHIGNVPRLRATAR